MLRQILLLLLSGLLLAACSAPLTTTHPDQLTYPELKYDFPSVEQFQLDNGMRVYLLPDQELPLVDLSVTVGGGSTLDAADKTGISSLFASLLNSGGAGNLSPDQLEDELELMAAEFGVGRDSYATTIGLSLQSRDLERGLKILADVMRRPRFDPARFELLRNQIKESIRRQNDEPSSIAGRTLARANYGDHPFGRYATFETVDNIERDDLQHMHQRYFQPDNVWFAVSGDTDAEQLKKLLQGLFGDWQANEKLDLTPPPLPEPLPPSVWVAAKGIPQTTILMGHPGIDKDNPDMFAIKIANYILGGGGFNSRMMREIRSNRGLAYSAYSYFQTGRVLPELFIASSETKCVSTVEVIELMRGLMQQLQDEPISEEELSLAKESLINSFVFAFDNSQAVVSRRVRLDFYQYPEGYLETYRERLAAVSVADVQRVARKYLHPERLQIVLVGNEADFSSELPKLGLPVRKIELDGIN